MRKFILSLAVLALVSLALADGHAFVWPNAWTANPGEAVYGGTLRLSDIEDPRTLNPFVRAEANAVLDLTDDDGAALITRGPDSDVWLPYAAKSFTVSEDNTVVDVVLRDGIKWSDGTPVTIQDYMFRYLAETDPDVGSNAYDSWFIGDEQILLETTGEDSLRFTFPKPDRIAFPVVALIPAPDHILGETYRTGGAEALIAEWGTEVDVASTVWTSPWVPVAYTPGERVIFERNEYWGEWNVDEAGNALPYLDTVVSNIVESTDAALNLFLAGELDLFSPQNLDQVGLINVAVQNGDIDATVLENVSPVASSQFIVFNWNMASNPFKQELFRSTNFRRAMSHLVDRPAIIELVYGGSASAMWSNVYQVLDFWVNNDVPRYSYDPEEAARLLAEIGFSSTNDDGILIDTEGNELGFTLATNSGNSQREQILQIFADSAREIGVNAETSALDFNLLVDQLLSTGEDRPFDAILIGLRGGSRDWPFGSNVIPCGTNLHMYNTSGECLTPEETRMTELYYQGRETLDTEAAREIGLEIQRIQAELQPQIYTVSPSAHAAWLSSVGGQHPDGLINSIVGVRELPLTFQRP